MVMVVNSINGAYFQKPAPVRLSPYEIVATTARSSQALYLEEGSVRPESQIWLIRSCVRLKDVNTYRTQYVGMILSINGELPV